jgi:hypothetical protein
MTIGARAGGVVTGAGRGITGYAWGAAGGWNPFAVDAALALVSVCSDSSSSSVAPICGD